MLVQLGFVSDLFGNHIFWVLTRKIISRLADQGHEVVGNEAVAMGCQQFFEEHNIPYKVEPIPGIDGDVYTVSS